MIARLTALAIGVLGMVVLAGLARADELRPGYLDMAETAQGQWRVAWKQPLSTPPAGALPVPTLPANCTFGRPPQVGIAGLAATGTGQAACEGAIGGKVIGMPGMVGQSDMLVRIAPLGEPVQALRLTAADPQATIAPRPDRWQVLRTYFVLGVEHILTGWDHLLFVIALVLLVRSWRRVVWAATAFTLAHSVTLAAAALGFVGLPQRPVEALIALSIVFLAVEAVHAQRGQGSLTARFPWAVAFLFGLLHGFGFAGALREIGLPDGEVVPALLAFNIGVEAGQIAVIAAILAMLALIRKASLRALEPTVRVASYGIGITGAYWLIDRIIG